MPLAVDAIDRAWTDRRLGNTGGLRSPMSGIVGRRPGCYNIDPMIEIRPYKPQDERSVISLWNEAFPDDPPWNEPAAMIRRKLAVQPELFLVGVEDGRIVATVLAGYNGVRG